MFPFSPYNPYFIGLRLLLKNLFLTPIQFIYNYILKPTYNYTLSPIYNYILKPLYYNFIKKDKFVFLSYLFSLLISLPKHFLLGLARVIEIVGSKTKWINDFCKSLTKGAFGNAGLGAFLFGFLFPISVTIDVIADYQSWSDAYKTHANNYELNEKKYAFFYNLTFCIFLWIFTVFDILKFSIDIISNNPKTLQAILTISPVVDFLSSAITIVFIGIKLILIINEHLNLTQKLKLQENLNFRTAFFKALTANNCGLLFSYLTLLITFVVTILSLLLPSSVVIGIITSICFSIIIVAYLIRYGVQKYQEYNIEAEKTALKIDQTQFLAQAYVRKINLENIFAFDITKQQTSYELAMTDKDPPRYKTLYDIVTLNNTDISNLFFAGTKEERIKQIYAQVFNGPITYIQGQFTPIKLFSFFLNLSSTPPLIIQSAIFHPITLETAAATNTYIDFSPRTPDGNGGVFTREYCYIPLFHNYEDTKSILMTYLNIPFYLSTRCFHKNGIYEFIPLPKDQQPAKEHEDDPPAMLSIQAQTQEAATFISGLLAAHAFPKTKDFIKIIIWEKFKIGVQVLNHRISTTTDENERYMLLVSKLSLIAKIQNKSIIIIPRQEDAPDTGLPDTGLPDTGLSERLSEQEYNDFTQQLLDNIITLGDSERKIIPEALNYVFAHAFTLTGKQAIDTMNDLIEIIQLPALQELINNNRKLRANIAYAKGFVPARFAPQPPQTTLPIPSGSHHGSTAAASDSHSSANGSQMTLVEVGADSDVGATVTSKVVFQQQQLT